MLKKLNAFTDKFVPAGIHFSLDQLKQIRVLNNSSVIAAMFAWSYIGICWFIGYQIAVISLAISGMLFMVIPFLFKKGVSYTILANYFIVVAFATTMLYIYTQGGIKFSVLTPWMVFPICMAMLFLGLRYALIWTLICSTAVSVFIVLDFKEVNMPVMYNLDYELVYRWIAFNGLLFIILIVINIFKNSENFAKQKLEEKNQELESALDQLQSTQTHLIQKEKLASLGLVTAGIAHEISNPMNFVINFSKLTKDALIDFKESTSDEEKNDTLKTIETNSDKIVMNSARADQIVKRMLEYSSITMQEKSSFSLKELIQDCFNIALKTTVTHHKDFHCDFENVVDGMPNVFANNNDISRAIINLIINSFDSFETSHTAKPKVSFYAKQLGASLVVTIADNGGGIKPGTEDQIFVPFFTTKPTGKRVGLGLSHAHELIAANGGSIQVERNSANGTSFILTLPIG